MFNSSPLGIIIIIDDDQNITDLLRFNLSSEGFDVKIYTSANKIDLSEITNARLVIVDAMEQQFTGIDFTNKIKENPETAGVPVIICSSREGEDLIIKAFDAGADDFVTKPFSLRELIARVKAVLRRHPLKSSQRTVQTGITIPNLNLFIDTIGQRVLEDGVVVPLTKTEYAILLLLIKNQNSFFTRSEICEEVWKEEAGSNARIVDTNISRLRKKLGESGKHIINRYGLGYAFTDKIS